MKHYYVYSTDALGHVSMTEFATQSLAEAYAEATDQHAFIYTDHEVDVKGMKIERAVNQYETKKKKHIDMDAQEKEPLTK